MEKPVINIERKTEAWKCRICKRMVDPAKGKPITMETDQAIIHTFDYGHQHKFTFTIEKINGKDEVIPVESQ
jgi:hypothetical protein